MKTTGIGIDGCRAGWFAVVFDGHQAQAQLLTQIAEISDTTLINSPIWVDMPIGFVDEGAEGRTCDRLARRILSPLRHSSVFTPPCRAAVYADLADASTINYAHTGKKLSRQSINIIPKIRELDHYLQALPPVQQSSWYEAHPEVVFAAFQGLQPLVHSKKTAAGQAARLALLKPYFPNIDFWLQTTRAAYKASAVAIDDIYDALVLAIAAYLVRNQQALFISLPPSPPQDSIGRAMQIVYPQVGVLSES